MSKRNMITWAAVAIAVVLFLFAPQVFSVWWDGNFTNLQTKGILRPQGQLQYRVVALTPTAGTGFEIGETTSGIIFEIDPGHATIKGDSDACPYGNADTGVTVWVAPSTATTGDRIIGIQNIGTSGVTPIVVAMSGGEPVQTSSGTTVPGIYDAEGDIVFLRLPYNSGVSARMTSRVIQ